MVLARLKPVSLEDRTHMVRIMGDLHHLTAVSALSNWLEAAEGEQGTAEDLLRWVESMFSPMESLLGRLVGNGQFLTALAGKIGEPGFTAALELAESRDAGAVSSLRQMASLEGGLVSFLERRLGAFDDAMFGARAALRSEQATLEAGALTIRMDWPHLVKCATGLGLVVGGTVAAECGVKFAMPLAVAFGAVEVAVGAEMAVYGCLRMF
jgi:hypothetical protein